MRSFFVSYFSRIWNEYRFSFTLNLRICSVHKIFKHVKTCLINLWALVALGLSSCFGKSIVLKKTVKKITRQKYGPFESTVFLFAYLLDCLCVLLQSTKFDFGSSKFFFIKTYKFSCYLTICLQVEDSVYQLLKLLLMIALIFSWKEEIKSKKRPGFCCCYLTIELQKVYVEVLFENNQVKTSTKRFFVDNLKPAWLALHVIEDLIRRYSRCSCKEEM